MYKKYIFFILIITSFIKMGTLHSNDSNSQIKDILGRIEFLEKQNKNLHFHILSERIETLEKKENEQYNTKIPWATSLVGLVLGSVYARMKGVEQTIGEIPLLIISGVVIPVFMAAAFSHYNYQERIIREKKEILIDERYSYDQ